MATLTVEMNAYVPESWEIPPFPTAESEAESLLTDNYPDAFRAGITWAVTGQRITYSGPFAPLARLARIFSTIIELHIVSNADGTEIPW